ncbi:MAG TPA: hypothetical protein VFA78_07670 [Chloroflexota bacterium]|nr:hypothetical protein [Chloroflexota bacterium]
MAAGRGHIRLDRGRIIPTTRNAQTATEAAPETPTERTVYCKGCGAPLETRSRTERSRQPVEFMMCEPCRAEHGHALMPRPGAPTYCYRCGHLEEIFESGGISPAIYHVCPVCLPERIERYSAGDFDSV